MTEKLTSKETKLALKISDCKLMHLRDEGIIRAVKKGRAFFYNVDDVNKLIKESDQSNN